ncbi:MAG: iron export ABC transporter permease subunit FetB [candidate division Zixibacteria bacterium]|nr:iron export ABC transporter permease subunit FetB [candidate division Zixibacteria bacterium]
MIELLKGYTPVLVSLSLVIITFMISRYLKLGLEKELVINTIRSFAQLLLIGYLLEHIFAFNNVPLFFLVIFIMAIVGGNVARTRAPNIPKAFYLATFSILCGAYISIGLMLLTKVISTDPKYIIPLGGMIVGNSMNGTSLVMERIYSEVRSNSSRIELALGFGATSSAASKFLLKDSIKTGLMPTMNFMKVVGLVQLPGAMTGMILAGASPLEAVKIQIIVAYMLISGVSISAAIAALLARRRFFNKRHQLILK